MLAHELAQLLLAGPNELVVIKPLSITDSISGIQHVGAAVFLPFDDETEEPHKTRAKAIVLVAADESLNEDEDLEFLEGDEHIHPDLYEPPLGGFDEDSDDADR